MNAKQREKHRPAARAPLRAARPSGRTMASLSEAALLRSELYSEELGIDLAADSDSELFKWFLACVLLGARISETIAKHTYRTFERHGLLMPERILRAGWDYLVNPIMREGGYVRYDGKTSNEVLRNCEMLLKEYGGSFKRLHALARDSRDLEERLDRFFGVGPVTVNIFLRELRPRWAKADPEPLPAVKAMARRLKLDLGKHDRKSMAFVRLEAGLIRHRKELPRARASGAKGYITRPRR